MFLNNVWQITEPWTLKFGRASVENTLREHHDRIYGPVTSFNNRVVNWTF